MGVDCGAQQRSMRAGFTADDIKKGTCANVAL